MSDSKPAPVRLPATEPETADLVDIKRAQALLRRHEVRPLELPDGRVVMGIWSYSDSEAIRKALKITGQDTLPVQYIDSPATPDHMKGSELSADPVPLDVLRAMEAAPAEPWRVRDEMLANVRTFESFDDWTLERRRLESEGAAVVPPPEPGPPALDWKTIQHGWAVFGHWRRWDPAAAEAHRKSHQDEVRWLLDLGAGREGHRLKLLLNRLEKALQEVRKIIRCQPDPEAANQWFMETFRRDLQTMREQSGSGGSSLDASYSELDRLLLVLRRLGREIESRERHTSSLFD
jgi:hypothetical protein